MTADLLAAVEWVSPLLDSLIPESGRQGASLEEACSIANRAAAAIAAHKEAHRDGADDGCRCYSEGWRRAWAVIEARHREEVARGT